MRFGLCPISHRVYKVTLNWSHLLLYRLVDYTCRSVFATVHDMTVHRLHINAPRVPVQHRDGDDCCLHVPGEFALIFYYANFDKNAWCNISTLPVAPNTTVLLCKANTFYVCIIKRNFQFASSVIIDTT